MFHVLASLFYLCYTATSYCSTLTNAIFESISATKFLKILLLANPLPLVLSPLIGTGIYYWFLKPVSLGRAFAYALINLISSTIGLFLMFFMFSVIKLTLITEPSYALGAMSIAMLVLSGIIIDMLIMHHLFKYPYKTVAAPIVLDIAIRLALIMLLSKPMLGP